VSQVCPFTNPLSNTWFELLRCSHHTIPKYLSQDSQRVGVGAGRAGYFLDVIEPVGADFKGGHGSVIIPIMIQPVNDYNHVTPSPQARNVSHSLEALGQSAHFARCGGLLVRALYSGKNTPNTLRLGGITGEGLCIQNAGGGLTRKSEPSVVPGTRAVDVIEDAIRVGSETHAAIAPEVEVAEPRGGWAFGGAYE
jgi:hypothetical protein